ncbi:unnamed protein product [Sphagnum jensenii]
MEAYTSKASFYDNDALPKYERGVEREFSGKRKHRGLYVCKDGFAVNADVNGSMNIGRKVIPEFLGIGDRKPCRKASSCQSSAMGMACAPILKVLIPQYKAFAATLRAGKPDPNIIRPSTEITYIGKGEMPPLHKRAIANEFWFVKTLPNGWIVDGDEERVRKFVGQNFDWAINGKPNEKIVEVPPSDEQTVTEAVAPVAE